MKQITLLFFLGIFLFISSCGSDDDDVGPTNLEEDLVLIEQYLTDNNLTAVKTSSGLHYIVTEEGTGPQIENGKFVRLHYTGRFLNGTAFDSSSDPGRSPLQYTQGSGQLIPGFEEGASYLKEGGTGIIILPSYLAYGTTGAGSIPPNTVIMFELAILNVN